MGIKSDFKAGVVGRYTEDRDIQVAWDAYLYGVKRTVRELITTYAGGGDAAMMDAADSIKDEMDGFFPKPQ